MSFSISGSGHIDAPEDGSQTAAEVEAELADKLHEVLGDPKYGVATAGFYGSHTSVDLLNPVKAEVASASDESDESDERDPDDED